MVPGRGEGNLRRRFTLSFDWRWLSGFPIGALYHELDRLLCPHRWGWNRKGDRRVLSYQYGGESEAGLGPPGAQENWRRMALLELSDVQLLKGAWQTAENHSRPAHGMERVEIDVEDQPERD